MILSDLGDLELARQLRRGELVVQSGPFKFRLRTALDSIAEGLQLLYADYPVGDPEDFSDFNLNLEQGAGIHRWWRRQVRVSFDGNYPFQPLPISHAYPQLEWAMNWCISTQAHFYLTLHAAVIERNGFAAIMPAPPGSGKSTLCAGLTSRGWRLLSDELALISLVDRTVCALARPISLKNESIDVIHAYVPDAVYNRVTHDTSKGSVTHMKVPSHQLRRIDETAAPRWVIFPKYVRNAPAELISHSRAQSMLDLGRNSFNYSLLGLTGFEVLSKVVSVCDCYQFSYSQLDDAVAAFDRLATETAGCV